MANRGINKVILVGNLGADPDIRYLPSGSSVTFIRLATGEAWKDQEGQVQERTEWHRVVFYRRLAEIAAEYLKKGSKIYIEGSLRTQQWEKDGEKRYTTEVIGKDLHMLDKASAAETVYSQPISPQPDYSGVVAKKTKPQQAQVSIRANQALVTEDSFDDDIPF